MSEVSELSPRGNHSRMKPFQNKMSHNYRSSFNASLLRMVVWEVARMGGNWQKTPDFDFFFCEYSKNTANGARDDV